MMKLRFAIALQLVSIACSSSSSLLAEDCNENGVEDAQEIGADPALDCNGNGIPDECDLEPVVEFSRVPRVDVGTRILSMGAGDLAGDEREEVVVYLPDESTLQVLSFELDSGAQVVGTLEDVTGSSVDIVVGDVDSDGNGDVVFDQPVPDTNDVQLVIATGNGTGALERSWTVPLAGETRPLAVVDVNGDGAMDVIVSSGASNDVATILLGDGGGGFEPLQEPESLQVWSRFLTGDFNGDGLLDLAGFRPGGSLVVAVFLASSDGVFEEPSLVQSPLTRRDLEAAATGDFDGDGILDLAMAHEGLRAGVARIELFRGSGDGNFEAHGELAMPFAMRDLVFHDFDGKGRDDLVVLSRSHTISVFTALDTVSFAAPRHFATGTSRGSFLPSFAVGSAQGTERKRFFAFTEDVPAFSVFETDGVNGIHGPQVFLTETAGDRVMARDVDSDGAIDVALGIQSVEDEAFVSYFRNRGDAIAEELNPSTDFERVLVPLGLPLRTPRFRSVPEVVLPASFSDDGLLDFLSLDPTLAVTSRADGTYATWELAARANENLPAAVADFDGDGLTDFAIGADRIILHFGDGTGQFPVHTSSSPIEALALASSDLDRDGRDDLVAIDPEQEAFSIFLAGEDRKLRPPTTLLAGSRPLYLQLADIDSDGRDDLLAIDRFPWAFLVARGLGQGEFASVSRHPFERDPKGLETGQLIVGNLDGRRELDAVFGEIYSDELVCLLNPFSEARVRKAPIGFPFRHATPLSSDPSDRLDLLATTPDGVTVVRNLTTGRLGTDCDENGILDSCELRDGLHADVNGNEVPDVCETDCDGNAVPDTYQIAADRSLDCDRNGRLDSCQIHSRPGLDCDGDAVLDSCQLEANPTLDLDRDGLLDACQQDCDENGVSDRIEIARGSARDCNSNAIPDRCEIADGSGADCDEDGLLDECEANPSLRFQTSERFLPNLRVGNRSSDLARFAHRADLNGDGFDDVLAWHPRGAVLALLAVQTGKPRWHSILELPGSPIPSPPVGLIDVVGGDFNGDGMIDLALLTNQERNDRGPTLRFFRGEPGPHFVAESAFLATGDGIQPIRTVDLDGDGREDLLGSSDGRSGLEVLFLGADFAPARKLTLATDGEPFGNPAVADVDADGFLDVIAHDSGQPEIVKVWFGDRDAEFTRESLTSFNTISIREFVVARLDGDERADLLVRGSSSQRLYLASGRPDDRFTLPQPVFIEAGGDVEALGVDDLDQDGHLDVFLRRGPDDFPVATPPTVNILWGKEDRIFHPSDFTELVLDPVSGTMGDRLGNMTIDLDADGVLEPLIWSEGVLQARAIEPRRFEAVEILSLDRGGRLFHEDLDRDGTRELLLIGIEEPVRTIRRLRPSGDSSATLERVLSMDRMASPIWIDDLDGDGAIDFLARFSPVGRGEPPTFGLLDSSGQPQSDRFEFEGFEEIHSGHDFDGDGATELLIRRQSRLEIVSWRNDPPGFDVDTTFAGSHFSGSGVSVDLDRDGHLDVLLQAGDIIRVAWGFGAGRFAIRSVASTTGGAEGIGAADVNLDGLPDLVVADFAGSEAEIVTYLQAPDRTFVSGPASQVRTDSNCFEVHDFNGDGIDDLLWDTDDLQISRGLADGTFAQTESFVVGTAPESPSVTEWRHVMDWNGDGRPDLVAAADRVISIVLNTTRHYSELDCDGNGVPDGCDIDRGTFLDRDENGIPDTCEPDCNGNDLPDAFEVRTGLIADCDGNGVPDECDVASGAVEDCDGNGVPDACDLLSTVSPPPDRNENGRLDRCEPTTCRVPGDCNRDDFVDISDAICLIGGLFFTADQPLPCGGGQPSDAGNQILFDWQGDGQVDLSDPIALLRYLFFSESPHALAVTGNEQRGCIDVIDCP